MEVKEDSKLTMGRKAMTVKFILPALVEAIDQKWRPIKYSLFPPLGLATLEAYLGGTTS